jgi:two-component system, OmpR family, sensor kinase
MTNAPIIPSIERYLRVRMLAVISALWLAGCVVAGLVLWHENSEVLDGALSETAQHLLTLSINEDADEPGDMLSDVLPHEEKVIYQLQDNRGAVLVRSHFAPKAALGAGLADGLHAEGPLRMAVVTGRTGLRRAVVAESGSHRLTALRDSLLALVLPLCLLLPVAALIMRKLLHQSMSTMHHLGQVINGRSASELDEFPESGAPEELQPLIRALNGMMLRIRELLEAERTFASNAAHELRTPLAAARAQAQRLLQVAPDASVATKARALMRQMDRLEDYTTRLLDLSRVEAAGMRRDRVNLTQLVHWVVEEHQ